MLKYKQSHYNFVVSSGEYVCLYNTKTGCVGVLKEDKAKILKILNNPDSYIGTDLFTDLLESQFVIENDKDEIYEVASSFENANQYDNSLNIVILPTEGCNFICPYCFIKEDNTHMDKTVYDSILHFIDKQYDASNLKNGEMLDVSIGWFGGEPTLCVDDIVEFMNNLVTRKRSLNVQSKMVTNGYLLSAQLFQRLLNANITNFQITLDGTAINHDKYRKLKNGKGTFDVIYGNLIKIRDEIKQDFQISIRGNFNKENLSAMEELIEIYINDFGNDSRFDLSFRPVLNYDQQKNESECNNISFCSKQEALEIQSKLASLIYSDGSLNTTNRMFDVLPEPINKWCNVTRKNSIIIDPKANIFACDSVISDKSEAIGKLDKLGNITYFKTEKKWRETIFQTDNYAKCQQCRLMPVCLGGCTRERIKNGCGCCTWTSDYIENMMKNYCKG